MHHLLGRSKTHKANGPIDQAAGAGASGTMASMSKPPKADLQLAGTAPATSQAGVFTTRPASYMTQRLRLDA